MVSGLFPFIAEATVARHAAPARNAGHPHERAASLRAHGFYKRLKGGGREYAEIKRLWVAPAARGLRLGRRLMDVTEDAARGLGIKLLRLDTNSALAEAGQLYRRSGWSEIPRFNEDPYPDLFFEKRL